MIHYLRTLAISHRIGLISFMIPWGMYFMVMWSRMFFINSEGMFAGHPWVWADWGLHIALTAAFVYKPLGLWFEAYPLFAGEKLTYPFMTNLISALLIRIGLPWYWAFLIPSLILSLAILIFLYSVFYRFLKKPVWASLASTVFLCSGGLGIVFNSLDLGFLTTLADSTIINSAVSDYQIEVNNITTSMIFPQRAYLLGLPISLGIIWVLYKIFLESQDRNVKWQLIIVGVLAGFLPITHTHSFIVIVLLSVWLFGWYWMKFKLWCWYGIPAVITTGVLYFLFWHGNLSGGQFLTWHPGWYIQTNWWDWVVFWIVNWGFFGLGAILGTLVILFRRDKKLVVHTGFFWSLFILANLVQFQPQLWDNTKIFAWVYWGLCIPYVLFLKGIMDSTSPVILKTTVCIAMVIFTIASGALDIAHNLDHDRKTFQMLSTDQMELGIYIRDHTHPSSVVLTTDSVDNPVAMMSGRSVLLGYAGWMLNFALPYQQRQLDIPTMYQNPQDSTEIFDKYNIGYVVVSRDELPYNPGKFNQGFEPVFINSYGVVYKRL